MTTSLSPCLISTSRLSSLAMVSYPLLPFPNTQVGFTPAQCRKSFWSWCNSTGPVMMLTCNMRSEESLHGTPKVGVRSRRMKKRERSHDIVDSKYSSNDLLPQLRIKDHGEVVMHRFRDDLVHLKNVIGTKNLTADDQLELAKGVQDLLVVNGVKSRLEKHIGRAPSLAEWAGAMRMESTALSQRQSYGNSCWQALIRNNLRLVVHIANRYRGRDLSSQDLVQAGTKGLLEACAKFDATKGVKFSSYAYFWIVCMIEKAFAHESKSLRLPKHFFIGLQTLRKTRKLIQEAKTEDNSKRLENFQQHSGLRQLASQTGFSENISRVPLQLSKGSKSLHDVIPTGDKLMDVLADTNIDSTEATAYRHIMKSDIQNALLTLRPRDREVLKLRYGLENGHAKSLQEVGDILGLTRERIRQIESRALRHPRNQESTNALEGYIDESYMA